MVRMRASSTVEGEECVAMAYHELGMIAVLSSLLLLVIQYHCLYENCFVLFAKERERESCK